VSRRSQTVRRRTHRGATPLRDPSPWSIFVLALLGLWATLAIFGSATALVPASESAAAVAIADSVPQGPCDAGDPTGAATPTEEKDLEDDDDAATPSGIPVAASHSRPHVRPDGVGDPSTRHCIVEVFRPPEAVTR
jgi:hypothetical protein